jgi:hypothetical protein
MNVYNLYRNVCSIQGGRKMEIWEASYIAGIVDGEGSITLT